MKKVSKGRGAVWAGILMIALIVGVGGCGSKATQSGAPDQTQQSDSESQNNQGDSAKRPGANPAVAAAMSIRRLQGNEQVALTGEQKEAVKPILQSLIDTADPGEEFLREKAEAMEAVFSDEQKTYLKEHSSQGNPQGKGQNNRPQGEAKEPPKDQADGQPQGRPDNQSQERTKGEKNIFQEVLDSLN